MSNMTDQISSHTNIKAQGGRSYRVSDQSSTLAQPVFVGTFLFIVLSLAVEYAIGDFIGLNAGEDLGLVIGSTVLTGIGVGVIAGVIHDWNKHAKRQ